MYDEDDWFDRHPWMYAIAPVLPGVIMLAVCVIWSMCLFWWWFW